MFRSILQSSKLHVFLQTSPKKVSRKVYQTGFNAAASKPYTTKDNTKLWKQSRTLNLDFTAVEIHSLK